MSSSSSNCGCHSGSSHCPLKVAIIGTGAGGMGALFALQHTAHKVHVFEASNRPGGHSFTYPHRAEDSTVGVDLGFITFNEITYPNFTAAIKHLGIAYNSAPSDLSVSRWIGSPLEWASSKVFVQPRNIIRPSFWRMLFDIVRFNHLSQEVLTEPANKGKEFSETLDDYLAREAYSPQFRDDYLIPVMRLLWSTESDDLRRRFPMKTLISYLWKHNLFISIFKAYKWLTIENGTDQYVRTVLELYPPENIHVNCPVQSVTQDHHGRLVVQHQVADGSVKREAFDHVIMACHAQQALELIATACMPAEVDILRRFQTTTKQVAFHTDPEYMPKRRGSWSCWNYKSAPGEDTNTVSSVTCWINAMMRLPVSKYGDLFTTLNPIRPIAPQHFIASWTAAHPLMTPESAWAQRALPSIQNLRGISYCGAWTGYGLHEDGFTSGLRVAIDFLGGSVPFPLQNDNPASNIARKTWLNRCLCRVLQVVQTLIVVFARVKHSHDRI